MAYTPNTHDALCVCSNTQPSTQENTQETAEVIFTQEEIDRWN